MFIFTEPMEKLKQTLYQLEAKQTKLYDNDVTVAKCAFAIATWSGQSEPLGDFYIVFFESYGNGRVVTIMEWCVYIAKISLQVLRASN